MRNFFIFLGNFHLKSQFPYFVCGLKNIFLDGNHF